MAKVKVIAPNEHYTGLSAGVMFVNGVGETDNEYLLGWFESKGYKVDRPEPEPETPPIEPPEPPDPPVEGSEAAGEALEEEPTKPARKGK